MLSLLAPMLMGMLAKKKKEGNVSDHNIGSLTDTFKNSLGSATGGGIFDLAKEVLDKDHDGSVMDDLMGGLFGKK